MPPSVHPSKGEHFSSSHPYPYHRETLVPYGTFPGMPQWKKISLGSESWIFPFPHCWRDQKIFMVNTGTKMWILWAQITEKLSEPDQLLSLDLYSGLLNAAYRNLKKTEWPSPRNKIFSIFQALKWPHHILPARPSWGGAVLAQGWADGALMCPGAPSWPLHPPCPTSCSSTHQPGQMSWVSWGVQNGMKCLHWGHWTAQESSQSSSCLPQGYSLCPVRGAGYAGWPVGMDRLLWRTMRAGADLHCS